MSLPADIADPTAALAAYLFDTLEAVEGNLEAGLKIYSPELPSSEIPLMPRACVIVLPDPSGGTGRLYGRTDLPVWDSRLAFTCYGSTRYESQQLGRGVQYALGVLKASLWENVKLYHAVVESSMSGMQVKMDKDTLWPTTILFAQVTHDMESH